jgi:hypothetical protein
VPAPLRAISPVVATPFIVTVPEPFAVIDQVITLVGRTKVEPLATDTKYGVKGCPCPEYIRAGALRTLDGA